VSDSTDIASPTLFSVDIQDGNPATGETVCSYLAPVPPRGTGFHRFVFTLYTHTTPLISTELRSVRQEASWYVTRLVHVGLVTKQSVSHTVVPDKGSVQDAGVGQCRT